MAEKIQGYEFAIDMNDGGMTRTLKEIRTDAKLLKSAMRANFDEIRSGEGIMAAYAHKVDDAGRAISGQKLEIEKLRSEQSDLDQSTAKGREAYAKYENQIQSAKREIANLQGQQERAAKSLDLQRSGVLKLKDATELQERSVKSSVSVLEAQGRTFEAQKAKLNGLVGVHERMKTQLEAEKNRMTELSSKYGKASKDAQEQAIRVNELTAKYRLNENEIKSVNRSVGGISTAGIKMRDNMSIASAKVKTSLGGIKNAALVASGGIAVIGAAALSGAKKASTLQNSYKQTTNLLTTGGEKSAEAIKNVSKMQKDGEKYSVKYGKSQKDIAAQYQELVKRGYTSTEALGAMRTELQASVASGDDFSDVVTVASQTVDAFGMRTNNTAKMTKNTRTAVNELAYSADMTATSFGALGKGMEYVGDSSHSAGISLSVTSAALGLLSNHGLEADKAGTGLRKVINSLTTDVKNIDSKNSVLKKLGIQKSDILDANGNLKNLTSIMGVINDKTKNMGKGTKNAVFNSLFGTTGQQAGIILAQNNKELGTLANKVEKAGRSGSYVQKLADKNSTTAQQSEARFKQAWSNLTIMFGAKMLPYMTDASNRLSKMFSEKGFRQDVDRAATGVGKVAGGIEKVGAFAVEHYKAVEKIATAMGTIWAVNKIAKFSGSLQNLGIIQSSESKKIAAQTALVEAQTKAYETNTAVKESNVSVTPTTGVTGEGKAVATASRTGQAATTGAGIVGDAEKAVTKGGSKWNLLGKTLGGRLINGAGLALTAWDAGASIAKAVGSGKAKDKYKAVGKTAGTVIGGAIGAIGGPTGAMIGAGIGEQLGSSKTAQKITKGLVKAFSGAKTPKIKVDVESTKKAYSQLNSEAKKYYASKEKQDKKDLKILYKNGDLTKAEYAKRLAEVKKEGTQSAKFEKMSQSDRNAVTKYYAQSRSSLETKWNKKIASDTSSWNSKILKDTEKYGANSVKVQRDEKKKSAAIKSDESKKSKSLNRQELKFATSVTAREAKLHTTLNGKIKLAANKQKNILSKLIKGKGKLRNKEVQQAVDSSEKEYKKTVSYADKELKRKEAAAKKQHNKVTRAAERQAKEVIKSADSQYKNTVAAAKRQYSGNSKYAKDQRAKVVKHAKKQRDETVGKAIDQENKTKKHADAQYTSVTKAAEKQHKDTVKKATKQKKAVVEQAKHQSKGVVTHATRQANSSDKANAKQGSGLAKIWQGIASFFNKLSKPFGVKKIDASGYSTGYAPMGMPTYAKGGSIAKTTQALVGEGGIEARISKKNGRIDFLGANGASIEKVEAGDQILNANDTAKLFGGGLGHTLPGYAKGTVDITTFLKKIKSGATDMFDDVSDATSKVLSKLTHPLKTLKSIASKIFNPKKAAGVGWIGQDLGQGMLDRALKGVSSVLSKIRKSVDAGTAGNPGGSGVTRWKPIIRKAAAKMHVNLTSAGMSAILHRINQESGGSATVQNNWDSNAKAGHPSAGLLQYIMPTLSAWVPKGTKAVLHNGYVQLLAMFNDSNWLRDISVSGGWGPTGHKRFANGGISYVNQMAEISEGNKPEAIVPLDLSKRSRTYQVLGEIVAHIAGDKNISGLTQGNTVATDNSADLTKIESILTQITSVLNGVIPAIYGASPTAKQMSDLVKKQQALETQQYNRARGLSS
ncbi:phage tail tape measure protein [Pediococcus ethanolidurans]